VVTMVGADIRVAALDERATHREGRDESSRCMAANERMRELVKAHGKPLYRFLLGVAFGERQLVEDLLQETLVRAWKNLDQLAPDADTLRPWLLTVARRMPSIRPGPARPGRRRSATWT
jgi:RNA polymerase sigma-70 factor, ECF subfamily